jgi:hypothetical protein
MGLATKIDCAGEEWLCRVLLLWRLRPLETFHQVEALWTTRLPVWGSLKTWIQILTPANISVDTHVELHAVCRLPFFSA